jgi:hypothetical protein
MSLICVQCGRIIIMSDNPDHYGNCLTCPVSTLTDAHKAQIEQFRPFPKKNRKPLGKEDE